MNSALSAPLAGITWLNILQMHDAERFFSDLFIFSLNFTGEPQRRPGSTRFTITVEINIDVTTTEAIRVLLRALSIFSEWSVKPKEK